MIGTMVIFLTPLVVAVGWSVHSPSERRLQAFAGRYGIGLDDVSRSFLARRLRTARCWRAAGGMVGWFLASLPVLVTLVRPAAAARFLVDEALRADTVRRIAAVGLLVVGGAAVTIVMALVPFTSAWYGFVMLGAMALNWVLLGACSALVWTTGWRPPTAQSA